MRQYRQYINLYKRIKRRGVGWIIPWRPQTFRAFMMGWRQTIGAVAVGAAALAAYIIYRIL